jgi:phage virion morphogenesis protein
MVAALAWIEKEQPQLLQTADNTPFQFEAELLDSDTYDLQLSIELTEPVLVLPARTDRASTSSTRPSRRYRRCSPGHGHVPPGLRQCRQARAIAHARGAGSMTGDDLAEIERLAGALLRNLSAGQRRKLLRKMARDLAASQRQRIAAQHQPDGSAFAPRKQKAQPVTGRGAACFLYPAGGSGPPRRVIMKSFTWGTGRSMTGFDIEAGGIRTFEFAKVVQWLPVPPEYRNRTSGRLRRRGNLRRKAMFRKLASARYLKAQADDQGFWVGFSGKVSQIASIHQNGLRDKPSLRTRAIDYPRRELLGTTPTDREHLLDLLYEQLAGA